MNQPVPCFHCGEPTDPAQPFSAVVLSETRPMCCPGCKAVAEAIVDNGLEDYYQFRTEPAIKGQSLGDQALSKLTVFDEPALQEEFVFDEGKHKQIELTLEGITCAACAWLIEKQLSKVKGVKQIAVNVAQRRAIVSWAPEEITLSNIMSTLQRVGYPALPFHAGQHEESYKKEDKLFLKKLGLAGLMTMQVMMLAAALYFDLFDSMDSTTREYFHWIALVLTTPVVLYSGSTFYLGALKALSARTVNMDVPVTIAIFATYLAGLKATLFQQGDVYFESICMFIFLLLLSRFLEHRSRHKAAQISANLMQYIPVTASTQASDGSIREVLAKTLAIDEVVIVKAGETIPIDGVVIDGVSSVDESMLTGEFEPVKKQPNYTVYGGTINQTGVLRVRVTHTLKHALVNQIIRLQSQALASKPRIALMADKFASYFVLAVLLVASFTYAFWWFKGSESGFWITISVLVATCPCALGLATPSALTCAMAALNKRGILVKRADALEQVNLIDTLVMDKTGTLTEGRFSIAESWYKQDNQEAWHIAVSLEALSEHPISRAFQGDSIKRVDQFEVVPGGGIFGVIDNTEYKMGSAAFTAVDPQALPITANVFLVSEQQCIAAFHVTDSIKRDAIDTLTHLRNKHLVLLSGDIQENVDKVAKAVDIPQAMGGRTPQEKFDAVQSMQSNGKKVMMMGDGINDAPVLAAADVSVAVGNASDIAKNAADVLLINDKLSSLPQIFAMARRVNRTIKQNMAWALGYNVLILPFAVSGILTPWMAVIGMSISSIIVVTNSTRLLK
ncbi:heavy metal translocating P-type ATPase [Aestuariibacter sp. A3R04]|uniref:heavy metal translocating P-type ATPase n=1 Tax=Aestuariibacter sp. A3R04 TaxID=2841571 RepID=UPI001C0815E3|nr:cadmium-translocating P-type ATPase [Aestuariibacter sp. A3R04]